MENKTRREKIAAIKAEIEAVVAGLEKINEQIAEAKTKMQALQEKLQDERAAEQAELDEWEADEENEGEDNDEARDLIDTLDNADAEMESATFNWLDPLDLDDAKAAIEQLNSI